ncbi:MAG TPA: DUF3352 domain-containing protein [Cryomorphaceae bacterium]|nr:DUF3352 domain-containing protein [Cryomorphaceae bacterium]
MKKLVGILLFAALIALAIVAFYKSMDDSRSASSIALRAIPQGAAVIVETDEIGELWRDLSQTNIIWEELQASDFFFRLNEAGHAIDSLMVNNAQIRGYLADNPAALSVHMSGARDHSYLLSLQLKDEVKEREAAEMLTAVFPSASVTDRNYDGVVIRKVESPVFNSTLHFFAHKGLLVMSLSAILAEEAVRAIEQEASVTANPDFVEVRETRGSNVRAAVYINYKEFKSVVKPYANQQRQSDAFFSNPYAEWSALDLSLKANALAMDGFLTCADSTDAWLGSFRNLEAPKLEVLDYMPNNTAYFAFLGFGNYAEYKKQFLRTIERSNENYAFDSAIENYDKRCNCDFSSLALDWIGSQAAAFIVEPASKNYSQNAYAVFRAVSGEDASERLADLEKALSETAENTEETAFEVYKDREIRQLKIGKFYGEILSESFSLLDDPYYVQYDDAILMANSVNALRNLINAVEVGRTLSKDEGFLELSEHLSSRSNFVLFSSLARSPLVYQNILSDENAANLDKQTELLRKFNAFIYQVDHYKNDLYYNHIYFKHGPEYKQETNSLWELQLKAEVNSKPTFVVNHYTDALEIAVQDAENRLYLISNTGKVLWERELDGKILGEIEQIDVYRNRKFQMIFNTENSVYLLDRNGNDVESFPVALKTPATAPIGVADYDNSRDYRIFICRKGGEIDLLDGKGNPVDGWKFADANQNLIAPAQHLRIRSKDYIFTASESGKIFLLNRTGEIRHKVDLELENPARGQFWIELGNQIKESQLHYVDDEGNAVALKFNNRFDKVKLTNDPILFYDYKEITADGEKNIVTLSEKEISAYNLSGEPIFSRALDGDVSEFQFFKFSGNTRRLGYTEKGKDQIHLINASGENVDGFPLYGSTAFSIGDMNKDGNYNLVVGGADGFVYTYAVTP